MRWMPRIGDIIASSVTQDFFNRKRIVPVPPGTPFTVVYSEDSGHGSRAHNIDIYHPDMGVKSRVIYEGDWYIVSEESQKEGG